MNYLYVNPSLQILSPNDTLLINGGTFEDLCHGIFVIGCGAIGSVGGPVGGIAGAIIGEIIWEICWG